MEDSGYDDVGTNYLGLILTTKRPRSLPYQVSSSGAPTAGDPGSPGGGLVINRSLSTLHHAILTLLAANPRGMLRYTSRPPSIERFCRRRHTSSGQGEGRGMCFVNGTCRAVHAGDMEGDDPLLCCAAP